MKMIKLVAFFAVLFLLIGCASGSPANKPVPASSGVNTGSRTAKGAGGDELDRAIREISDYLNKRIPKGTKAVFLNIRSDWPDLSGYILDGLMENAVNDEVFAVVDRQQIDAIRSELNFQWSGEVSDASAQEIGQMLGAQTIVSGSVTTIGSIYRIQARAIAVQTAAVQGQFSQNVDGKGPTISALTERKAPAGSSTAAAASRPSAGTQATTPAAGGTAQAKPAAPATPAAPAQPSAPAATTYKVGDKGPAGGLIFYDKGNNSSGWRYLEAAPVEAEFQALWSVRSTPVDNTQTGIGYGKRNTQLIVETFKKASGEWDTAAQKVDELVFNGFDDWFLPSKDELDQMYGNLKRKNLGDFKDDWYWCSTDTDYRRADTQHFKDGRMGSNYGSSTGEKSAYRNYVRPIRQF